jgi:predicted kinase
MAKTCYILRGLSGTGKSTFAKTIVNGGRIFSTDDLFMVDGEYQFDPSKLGEYHAENLRMATAFMEQTFHYPDPPTIVIDNTNTQHWEYAGYVEAAEEYGYEVVIISIAWKEEDIPLYAERNSHGVPEEAIRRMAERWEY